MITAIKGISITYLLAQFWLHGENYKHNEQSSLKNLNIDVALVSYCS